MMRFSAGSINVAGVEALRARHPLDHGEAVYAVDASIWIKNDAETSPKRGYYTNTIGILRASRWCWSYQWRAQVSFCPGSGCAPLSAQRAEPTDNVQ